MSRISADLMVVIGKYLLIERISSPVLPYFRGLQYASLNYKILILTDVFQGNIFIYLYIFFLLFIVHVAAIYVGQIYFRGRTLIMINFRITSSLLNEMFQQNTSNWLYFMTKKTYVFSKTVNLHEMKFEKKNIGMLIHEISFSPLPPTRALCEQVYK